MAVSAFLISSIGRSICTVRIISRPSAAKPFWPQRCRHAGSVASPIKTTEDRAFQTESVGKLDDVAAVGGLLPAPHDSVGNEAGWAKPASIWGDDPHSCLRQDRGHFIESMHVLGEAVRNDHWPAIGWTVFDVSARPGTSNFAICFSKARQSRIDGSSELA